MNIKKGRINEPYKAKTTKKFWNFLECTFFVEGTVIHQNQFICNKTSLLSTLNTCAPQALLDVPSTCGIRAVPSLNDIVASLK